MRAALAVLAAGVATLMATSALAAPATYKVPKNAFGQPDFSGVWSNATITRLERDPKYGDRVVLTADEVQAIEGASDKRNALLRANTDQTKKVDDLPECQSGAQGAACGYNAFWTDPGTRLIRIGPEARASILTGPTGRLPIKPEASARMRARFGNERVGNFDGPERRGVGERCLVGFGGSSGPPLMPVLYNNHYQIQQTGDSVVIVTEMVHDARVIRLNTKQHLPTAVRSWMGDSIGWWEGDTLVVETTNFRPDNVFRGATENQKVIERFTRISPQQIHYKFEVIDPSSYTTTVTGEQALNATKDQIYEYACHEGNYAMRGILAGAREEEKNGREQSGNRGEVTEEGGK